MPPNAFAYDVFLSYSSEDKATVRELADRLKQDGLRVWFDELEIRAGDNIMFKVEQGLESSRLLLLCMSSSAFGSEWAMLEAQTFRFRDPLNKERRFIPLRLDEAEPRGALAQFSYVDWRSPARERQYVRLLDACRLAPVETGVDDPDPTIPPAAATASVKPPNWSNSVDISPDGSSALSASNDHTIQLWDLDTGKLLRSLAGHTGAVRSIAWSPNGKMALSGSNDGTLRLWDFTTGQCVRALEGHASRVYSVAWVDEMRAISGSNDDTMRLWNVHTGQCTRTFEGHLGGVRTVACTGPWKGIHRRGISGSSDNTLRFWDLDTGQCIHVLRGHSGPIHTTAWSPYRRRALSGSADGTLRLWDMDTGHCLGILEGHTKLIYSASWSPTGGLVLSGSGDRTLRLWELERGSCLRVLAGHSGPVLGLAWSPDGRLALSVSGDNTLRLWAIHSGNCVRVLEGRPRYALWKSSSSSSPASNIAALGRLALAQAASATVFRHLQGTASLASTQRDQDTAVEPPGPGASPAVALQYTNAKILLVGDSGVGKTGLSKRLTHDSWKATESTAGAWATQWRLPVDQEGGIERELWLWDFGGQADQRLIHQIYMDETALAILVFDPQRENLFDALGQWDRELSRAATGPLQKVLVAGRIDTGGLRISRSKIEAFARERGYACYLETSAKTGEGCTALKEAILRSIQWANIPWRSSPHLFKRLKEEIISLKEEGRVLLRLNELRETLQLRMSSSAELFTDDQLRAVIRLLASPGVIWELDFGSWVLLQPELLNAYAQAAIRTMRADQLELGRILEEKVLRGDLAFGSAMERRPGDEERIVLLAMHQVLVERGLCLREHDPEGKRPTLLVFPSYYGRERPDLVGHPAVFVSYRFNGFLDDIYATLVVRLHHTQPFEQAELWRYAADFKTVLGKRLGIKLNRRAEGAGELEVYFDPAVSLEDKVVFSRYVHEHLLQKANDVERLRHYVCPHCGAPVGNREVAMKRLAEGKQDILCVSCESRVPLWDELEQRFASPETQKRVNELQEQARSVLTNEGRERTLVGDIISTVALAGQVSRELSTREHGLDMEIEFTTVEGKLSGQKLYLYLGNDAARHASDWERLPFPVRVVVRNPDGEIRWGDERLDVMSVRRWRDRTLESGITSAGG